ncbi:tRNA (adenine(22)-N(1))-methyltransferase [Vagococcus xieshaowenii]|uniref:tRNA (Adenine-N(1))-methyltransferase n=1 Tax=Vagococcus xieshaowenii TaxID=2562451 RepID=A0AAJ5EFP4_9ENTE|nr:tRNA (adenine(22)-N(1))-methyltransferase TrmK [Vagococcus xieshaowenii]QCA28632.1 tRNA (adenine-N(1))-methyltransferase [Vagococcus xieshaowenii]TFZ40560.1 tRNA (adenine-N(1))-methyltransferase [Vagococcus xieshaowenii]
MNEQKLSKRLERVASFVPKDAVVADIGSDHAYLPAWLYLNNKITRAIAGEVVEGPFNSAKSLVASLGLEDKISVRLADGLEVLSKEDNVTAITICGMGGSLIRDILSRGKHKGHLVGTERLILQPNVGEPTLRRWLQQEGYEILLEDILEEDQKIYEIIVAEKTGNKTDYDDKTLFFGPFLLKNHDEIFIKKWQYQLEKYHYILSSMEQATHVEPNKLIEVKEKISWIEEVM